MATIKSLVVSLKANSAKLVSDLKKSRKSINGWAKAVKSKVKSVSKLFGALTTVAIGGFIVAVNRSAAEIDKITKAAGKLQFPIEDYQRFAFVAAKSNIEMDSFGKAMQRMLRTVGDARAGLSTASDAFAQLNLNADDLAKLSPSQQFELIAQSMQGIETQADRVKVAMDIFGRQGADLLNVFAGDVKGIGSEFDSLGVTITQQQAEMVARFQDSKTTLGALFNGFSQNVTAAVSPAFTLIIEKITDSIKKMGGMKVVAEKFARFIVRGMIAGVEAVSSLTEGVLELQLALKKAELQFKIMDNLAGKLVPFGEDYSPAELQNVANDILAMEQRIAKGSGIKQSLIKLLNDLDDTIGSKQGGGGSTPIQATQVVANENIKLAKTTSELNKTLEQVTKAKAWKDIFGAEDITARANQFDQYAKLAKNNIASGSAFTASSIQTLNSILQTAINNGGQGFSNNNLFEKLDIQGMTEVVQGLEAMAAQQANAVPQQKASIDGLIQANQVSQNVVDKLLQSQQGQKTLGKLDLDFRTDTGRVAGEIWGEPEFLGRLQSEVNRQITNTARSAAGG